MVVLFNGLGTAKYEEMFVAYRTIEGQLEAAGLTVVDRLVGELVTSLDMGGVSLTLVWVDDELERLWKAPCDTPTVKMGQIAGEELTADEIQQVESAEQAIPEADDAGPATRGPRGARETPGDRGAEVVEEEVERRRLPRGAGRQARS